MKFQFAAIALAITGALSSGAMAVEPEIPGALPGGSTAAEPKPGPESESDQQDAVKQPGLHCVVDTVAVPEGAPFQENMAPSAAPQCFQAFAEAIFAATGGAVSVPADTRPEDFNEQLLQASPRPAASYVIGVEYQHADFKGWSRTYRSPRTCYGYVHYVPWVGADINDQISSAKAYSWCNHSVHYEHINFNRGTAGATRDCGSSCSYIGAAMNDKTSSIIWYRR